MKGLAICHKGIEDITALEVKEIVDEEAQVEERAVMFETTKPKLSKFTYMARSVQKTILLLGKAKINEKYDDTLPLIEKLIKNIEIKEWLKGTFKVECRREANILNHEFNSQTIAEKVGELLLKKHKSKVVMKDPDTIVYVFINENNLYLGIDFAGTDLSKRDYKIFSTASGLNGAVAYSLVRIAKLKHNETMLDPFVGAGTIPIEAALYLRNKSVNHFRKDKLKFNQFMKIKLEEEIYDSKAKIICYDQQINQMKATKKNAQIAGVQKDIFVSKVDIEWLDTKLDKESIDKIITQPPVPSKNFDQKDAEKVYREFFHQAEYVLKKDGKIIIIAEKTELIKKFADKFKIIESRELMQGKKVMKVLVLGR